MDKAQIIEELRQQAARLENLASAYEEFDDGQILGLEEDSPEWNEHVSNRCLLVSEVSDVLDDTVKIYAAMDDRLEVGWGAYRPPAH